MMTKEELFLLLKKRPDDLRGEELLMFRAALQLISPHLDLMSRDNIPIVQELLPELKDKKSILDVGCMFGWLHHYLKTNGIQMEYTGVDNWSAALECGKWLFPEVTFHKMNCMDINPSIGKFDVVWQCQILLPATDLQHFVDAALPLTNKLFVMIWPHHNGPEALKALQIPHEHRVYRQGRFDILAVHK